MRTLEIATLISVDGVVSDPQSWPGSYTDDDLMADWLRRLEVADAFLMGRGSYDYFAPTWPTAEGAYMDRLRQMPKYIYSSSLEDSEWENTTIVRNDTVEAVRRLKEADGGDLVVYGYGAFSQALFEHDLVDTLTFYIYPIVLASGSPLFRPGETRHLVLRGAKPRGSGVVEVSYGRGRT